MSVFSAATLPAAPQRGQTITHTTKTDRIAQCVISALLYAAPALTCAYAGGAQDPDIWWHLKTAQWIVAHHAVPHADPFSSTTIGHPWAAYSWLFDLMVYGLFHVFGLPGLAAFTAGMVLATTAALHAVIWRMCADFNLGVLLTFLACFTMTRLDSPRPWLWSILLFVVVFGALEAAAQRGETRRRLWLPPVFALWANLHIQFVDGLVLLFLLLGTAVASRWMPGLRVRISWRQAALVTVACLAAVCVNPYGWRIYGVAWGLMAQPGVLNRIAELAALPFRSLDDFCVLAIALSAAGALAARRRVLTFEGAAFAFATFVAFRSQRDLWVMAIVGSVLLAQAAPRPARNEARVSRLSTALAVAVAVLLTALGMAALRINSARLERQMAESLPVHAAAFVAATHQQGPLFNDYNWGGYLMWSLSLPVEMDGRAALHGTPQIERSVRTWRGAPDWAGDPNLKAANIVIGPLDSPLMQLLRMDPQFRLGFQDKTADVFLRVHPVH